MNTLGNRRCAPVALMLAAGLASPSLAIDKSWVCTSGAWANANCWSPLGTPGTFDVARLGDVNGIQDYNVRMDRDDEVAALHISNGMDLNTDGFVLEVSGTTTVSGRNSGYSMLRVEDATLGLEFFTGALSATNEGRVELIGGGIGVQNLMTIGAGSWLEGEGRVEFFGAGTTLSNSGTISADPAIYMYQVGNGLYDLDGGGDGRIDLNTGSQILALHGAGLADDFSGRILMVAGSQLHMNLANGWSVDSLGDVTAAGFAGFGPMRITGGDLSFGGFLDTIGPDTVLRLESDIEFQQSARIDMGPDDLIEVVGDAVVHGGAFILDDGAQLQFQGPTEVRGGTFQTFSPQSNESKVAFQGPTTWAASAAHFFGIAGQVGDATVAETTVIHAETFDMDGAGATAWDVQAALTINAVRLDLINSLFDGSMTVRGSGLSRLRINLEDPEARWNTTGPLTLRGMAGAQHLLATRVSGSPLGVYGELNVENGRVQVDAPTELLSGASVSIPNANDELRFNAPAIVDRQVAFTGDGTLETGPSGDLTLGDGLLMGSIGLENSGVLRIGQGAGVVSTDRFANGGTWIVDIGGYDAGDEHDRLIVAGSAVLGGTLQIHAADLDGDCIGFRPEVNDTFTILTAAGGVSGSFAEIVATSADGWGYEWELLESAHEVAVRVVSVTPVCRADMDGDGDTDADDFFAFLDGFASGNLDVCDLDDDGDCDADDFFCYLDLFSQGC